MKYTIEIWSRGLDVGIGSITKEQYEYWNEHQEDLEEALNSNYDYEENDCPEEAFLKEYYNEYDDVFFGFGPDRDYHEMTIKDDEGNIIYMGDLDGIMEEHDPDYEHGMSDHGDKDYYSNVLEPGYYIQWCQGGKGRYFDSDFEADYFDPKKLVFHISETDYGEIITGISYDNEELMNDAGDYDIKSFEANLIHNE